jgi:hypothetical protein
MSIPAVNLDPESIRSSLRPVRFRPRFVEASHTTDAKMPSNETLELIDGPPSGSTVIRRRDRTIARLRTISQYLPGWDGETGCAPRREAVDDAIDLVAHLTRELDFHAAPEPDGAVQLTIQAGGGRAILVFEGNRRVAIYLCRGEGEYDDDPVEVDVPARLGADQSLMSAIGPILLPDEL